MSEPRRHDLRLVVGGSEPEDRADETARPSKARPFEAPRDATLDELIDSVMGECLRHVAANRTPALSGDDPEGLHQLRVAIRRLRSALILFGGVLARERTAAVREELRWVTRRLSPARDWDVFRSETLFAVIEAAPGESGLERLAAETEAQREAAYALVRETLRSERFERLEHELRRYVGGRQWRPAPGSKRTKRLERRAGDAGAELLDRRLRRVRSLGRKSARLSRRDLHRLRIRVKQLRYACEFLAPVHPRDRARRYLRRLESLQDILGHVNDGRVAEALTASLIEGARGTGSEAELQRAAGLVLGWAHRTSSAERHRIQRAWRRLDEVRPFWH